jgi:F-type H+-transporting ATPase subunit b
VLLYRPVLNMPSAQTASHAAWPMWMPPAAAARVQLDYDRHIAEAQRKAQRSSAKPRKLARRYAMRRLRPGEAEAIKQKAHEEAAAEKARVLSEVQHQIAGLSMAATERVLGRAVDQKTQHDLIDQFMAELGK